MITTLKALGISGGIGFLGGLGLVAWIEPRTPGGTGLIIVAAVVAAFIVGGIIGSLRAKEPNKPR
jgi:hypothetical protein